MAQELLHRPQNFEPAPPLEDLPSCGDAGRVDPCLIERIKLAKNPTPSNLTITIQRRHRILHCLRVAGPPVAVVVVDPVSQRTANA